MNTVFMPVHLHMGISLPIFLYESEQLQTLLEIRLTSLRMYKHGPI